MVRPRPRCVRSHQQQNVCGANAMHLPAIDTCGESIPSRSRRFLQHNTSVRAQVAKTQQSSQAQRLAIVKQRSHARSGMQHLREGRMHINGQVRVAPARCSLRLVLEAYLLGVQQLSVVFPLVPLRQAAPLSLQVSRGARAVRTRTGASDGRSSRCPSSCETWQARHSAFYAAISVA